MYTLTLYRDDKSEWYGQYLESYCPAIFAIVHTTDQEALLDKWVSWMIEEPETCQYLFIDGVLVYAYGTDLVYTDLSGPGIDLSDFLFGEATVTPTTESTALVAEKDAAVEAHRRRVMEEIARRKQERAAEEKAAKDRADYEKYLALKERFGDEH